MASQRQPTGGLFGCGVTRVKKSDEPEDARRQPAAAAPIYIALGLLVVVATTAGLTVTATGALQGKATGGLYGWTAMFAARDGKALPATAKASPSAADDKAFALSDAAVVGPRPVLVHPARAIMQLDRLKWQAGNVSTTRFLDGHPVHHHVTDQSIIWDRQRKFWWEAETFMVLSHHLRRHRGPNSVVLDIGGWIGLTGLYIANFVPRVVAFEPDIAARSELVANVALNPLLEPRIHVYDSCISDKREQLAMKGDPGASWSSLMFIGDTKLPSWTVTCYPLEDLLVRAGVDGRDVIFLKIDIEGAEAHVLPAIGPWLKAHNLPTVFVSMHPWLWRREVDPAPGMASVFQMYNFVYDTGLNLVPRAAVNASLFGAGVEAYLLSMEQLAPIPHLQGFEYDRQGGVPLPMPATKPGEPRRYDSQLGVPLSRATLEDVRNTIDQAAVAAEAEAIEASFVAAVDEEEPAPSKQAKKAVDDSAEEGDGEEEGEEEEEPRPRRSVRKRKSSRRSRRGRRNED